MAVRRPTGDAHPMATNAALERPLEEPAPVVQKQSKTGLVLGLAALAVAAVGAAVLLQDPVTPGPESVETPDKTAEAFPSEVVPEESLEAAAPAPAEKAEVPTPAPVAKSAPVPVANTPKVEMVVVSVSSDPEGAVIQQGDTIHGVTPMVIRLPKSEEAVQLTLSKAGFQPHIFDVTLDKGHVLETDMKRKSTRADRKKRSWAKPRIAAPKTVKETKKVSTPVAAPKPAAKPKPKPKPKPKKRIDVLLD
jgi:hypothetical protein